MALTAISAADAASSRPQQELMEAAIIELQREKSLVVAGGSAGGAGFTATGLATDDHIVAVHRVHVTTTDVTYVTASGTPDTTATTTVVTGVAVTDVTTEATIPASNKLRLATTNTTGDTLVVTYHDVS